MLREIYAYLPSGQYALRPGRLIPVVLNPTEQEYEWIMNHPTAYSGFYDEHAVSGWIMMNHDTVQGDVYIWPTYAELASNAEFLQIHYACSFIVSFEIKRDVSGNQRLIWRNQSWFRRHRAWIYGLPFIKMLIRQDVAIVDD